MKEKIKVTVMEKKAYISPAMVSVALNMTSHLMDASNPKVSEDKAEKGVMESKSSGSWNLWGSDDE